MSNKSIVRWKLDENKELPLAIIEDTEDGMEIREIGEHTPENIEFAQSIIDDHNRSL